MEYVLQRFEEERQRSLLFGEFVLDTTSATVEETLAEFSARVDPHLTENDCLRMMTHQALQQNEQFHKVHINS